MGGNVFKNHNTKRISEDVLLELQKELSNLCNSNSVVHYFVKSVKEKKDHGDIDILYHGDLSFLSSLNYPIHKNGDVTSILYLNCYQVDFIKTNLDELKIASFFYDYNDFGNLCGRLLKKNGYKLKPSGLFYSYEGLYKKHDILLSKSIIDVLDILQLDINTYFNGFNTFNDMFTYISKVPTFSAYPYQLENVSNSDRARDKKRKTYMLFLDWINDPKNKIPSCSAGNLIYPIYKFDHLENIINDISLHDDKEKHFRDNFNGNIVSTLTGLVNKNLGDFMKHMTQKYDKEILRSYISSSEINNLILKEFSLWN